VITDKELAKVMAQLNGPAFMQIYAITERYIKRKLPEEYTPSPKTETHIELHPTQTIVAQQFLRACKDFLVRASTELAKQYRADAEALEAALQVIRKDDRRYFNSLMIPHEIMVDADAPEGEPVPVQLISHSGDRAVLALDQMAHRFREIADDYDKDSSNITFFYDIGRIFGRDKLPSAGEANAVYVILIAALRDVSPRRIRDIRKTEYDSTDDGKQIRDLMEAGAMQAIAQSVSS
jgi:hypothetical protein